MPPGEIGAMGLQNSNSATRGRVRITSVLCTVLHRQGREDIAT